MSLQTDIEKAHEPRDVDLSFASRGVWLVKVPKYLSDQWKSCSNGTDVGKLKIMKSNIPNKKPDVLFSSYDLSPSTSATPSGSGGSSDGRVGSGGGISTFGPVISTLNPPIAPAPPSKSATKPPKIRNHKFVITSVGTQNMVVMSQMKLDPVSAEAPTEKITIEGKVLQRAECSPSVDDLNYRQLKREQVKAFNTPQRRVQVLSNIVQSYKPVSDHSFNLQERKAKKMEAKRSRAEKDKVMDVLFNAFEKHQFYSIKDLITLTSQPMPYLKEILKEICNYNMSAPHKSMWELKPEFRHYKSHDAS